MAERGMSIERLAWSMALFWALWGIGFGLLIGYAWGVPPLAAIPPLLAAAIVGLANRDG